MEPTPGRFAATGVTLRELITLAYPAGVNLRNDDQVVTSEAWMGRSRFDVTATGAPATAATRPAAGAVAPPESTALDELRARAVTIPMVVSLLSNLPAVGHLVEDRTGLMGSFDLELTWSADAGPAPPPLPDAVNHTQSDGPSLFTAVPEQLGLELKAARSAVDVVVVDRAKLPTAN